VNPYSNLAAQDVVFGGLLYSRGNLFTEIGSKFNLLGSLLADRSISFKNLSRGHLTFDPASFEDHFDLAKLGLGVAFYWTDQ
jgi:hypothetical protein